MTPLRPVFDLSALYDQAAHLTSAAADKLADGDNEGAFSLLALRGQLVRQIQREASGPTPWGDDSGADAAALRYLAADRQLETLLDHCA